jgi:ATP-dependent protease ClpP protease subunit
MLHYGENSTAGHVKNTQNWIKFYQKMDRKLSIVLYNKIKEKNPRFSLQKLERLLEFDTILDADEAVNLGLADGKYGGSST